MSSTANPTGSRGSVTTLAQLLRGKIDAYLEATKSSEGRDQVPEPFHEVFSVDMSRRELLSEEQTEEPLIPELNAGVISTLVKKRKSHFIIEKLLPSGKVMEVKISRDKGSEGSKKPASKRRYVLMRNQITREIVPSAVSGSLRSDVHVASVVSGFSSSPGNENLAPLNAELRGNTNTRKKLEASKKNEKPKVQKRKPAKAPHLASSALTPNSNTVNAANSTPGSRPRPEENHEAERSQFPLDSDLADIFRIPTGDRGSELTPKCVNSVNKNKDALQKEYHPPQTSKRRQPSQSVGRKPLKIQNKGNRTDTPTTLQEDVDSFFESCEDEHGTQARMTQKKRKQSGHGYLCGLEGVGLRMVFHQFLHVGDSFEVLNAPIIELRHRPVSPHYAPYST
ncbi:hypothetical protein Y032_0080g1318 [Ancylostoma ceylanicum]|uniref:Uncharacterized protein n=1 Tax=Ancylostoma ceylanicum TaxID=53326 RepID=A0A016TSD6_9BILA|nr:hypothetical protein Y032_0080g1318 [Ancylostoma ceylanicum]